MDASGVEGHVDPEVGEKILSILLDNAIKFSPEGGSVAVTCNVLDAAPESVPETEEGKRASRWIRIAMKDNGPGVPAVDQARIFDVFEQGDASLSRSHEGTGLGLALGRSLARIHDGDVLLEETSARGSTFSMVIPDLPE